MIENDLSYIAGFVDGEGSITIVISKGKYHQPQITINNNCVDILMWIKDTLASFGVKMSLNKSQRCNRISARCKQATKLASILYPYLRVKKFQAEVLMRYESTIKPQVIVHENGRFKGRVPLDRVELDARNILTDSIRGANARYSSNVRMDYERPRIAGNQN